LRASSVMVAGRPQPAAALRPLLPLYVAIFVGCVGYSLMITVFVPTMLDAHGGLLSAHARMTRRTMLLGVLVSLYPLGQFFASPVIGALSDRAGRRPIWLVSLAVNAAGYAVIATALALHRLSVLMVGSLLVGLSDASRVIAQRVIADVASVERRGPSLRYIYLTASVACVLGPLVGGQLTDKTLVPWFRNPTPFWAVAGLLVVTLLIAAAAFRETNASPRGDEIDYGAALNSLFDAFVDPRLRGLYGANGLLYLAIYGFLRCYPMQLVGEFRMNVPQLAAVVAWVALPLVITNVWLNGLLARRVATPRIVAVSALLTGVGLIAVALPLDVYVLWGVLFLTGLALAVCLAACARMVVAAVTAVEEGRAMEDDRSLRAGVETLSGLLVGVLAAVKVSLALVALGLVAIVAANVAAQRARRAEL